MQHGTQQHIMIDRWAPAAFHARFRHELKEYTFNFPMSGPDHLYLAMTSGNRLLGFIKAEETPPDYYLNYIEVSPRHQGMGHSRRLLSELFDMAAKTNRAILISPYTPVGEQRLANQVRRLQANLPALYICYE